MLTSRPGRTHKIQLYVGFIDKQRFADLDHHAIFYIHQLVVKYQLAFWTPEIDAHDETTDYRFT
jgi:hypothetical protein